MSNAPVLEGQGPAGLRRLLGIAAVVCAAVATTLLALAGLVAGAGAAVVAVLALWALLDLPAAFVGLLVLSLLIPNGVSVYLGASLPLLTFQRVMLLLVTAAALVHMPGRTLAALWRTPYIKLLLAMTALLGLATLVSVDPASSRREFFSERELGIPLYFALLWLVIPSHAAARRVLKVVAGASLFIIALAVLEATTGRGVVASLGVLPLDKLTELGYRLELERRVGLPRVESVFQHPLLLGAFLVALLPLLLALRRAARTSGERWMWTVGLVAGFLALVYTWSRGAWLMLFVALLLQRGGGWKRWAVVGLLAIGLLVVAAQLDLLNPGTGVYRWYLLRSVVSTMWQRGGLGLGPATFLRHLTVRVSGTPLVLGTDPMAYSLTLAIEAGPIFTVLFWLLVGGIIREGRRARQQALSAGEGQRALLLDALTLGLLANLLLSVFSYSLFGNTVGLFVAYMLLVVTLRLARPDQATEPETRGT